MLTNIEFDSEMTFLTDEEFQAMVESSPNVKHTNYKYGQILAKITDGVYEYWSGNAILLRGYKFERFEEVDGQRKMYPYGVCDNYEQVFERDSRIKKYVNDPDNKYIIQLHWVSRTGKNGWRWHKNGTYIGDFDPQCEYLDDEEGIDGVFVYGIYSVEKVDNPDED